MVGGWTSVIEGTPSVSVGQTRKLESSCGDPRNGSEGAGVGGQRRVDRRERDLQTVRTGSAVPLDADRLDRGLPRTAADRQDRRR